MSDLPNSSVLRDVLISLHSDDEAKPPMTSAPFDLEQNLLNQVENWRKRLLDLGNRNPLINCSFHPSRGVLEIVHPEAETVWHKLAAEVEAGAETMRLPWRRELVPPPEKSDRNGEPTEPDAVAQEKKEWSPPLDECLVSRFLRDRDLLTPVGDKALDRRLRTFDSQARLSLSEQGVHCLYVAFGFLKWFESIDSDIEHFSPLMLVPVTLSRDSADAPWELAEAEDDAIDNLCLRERLKQDFRLELPPLPDINDLEEPEARLAFLDAVREAVRKNDRWEVLDKCAIGRFAFPKVAMWKDLGDHRDGVIAHALCRSIGGDTGVPPQLAFGAAEKLPDASRLDDEVPPGEVKAILDCDSSQLEAIVAARRGVSFVLDGPPGTGKSQTIANIIADALSEGRRVLFVSEKISALEVVKRRLDDCGLGDFCLECHSSKANRKSVMQELEWCLNLDAEVYDDATPKIAELKRQRDALNAYVRAVHRPREPLGVSAYELYGQISRATRLGFVGKSRCPIPDPSAADRAKLDEWLQLLDRAAELAGVILEHETHPWRGCILTSRSLSLDDDIRHHIGILVAAFGRMETVTRPLLLERLLLQEITPATLDDVLRTFRESLKVPPIPDSWFALPKETAIAVQSLLRAEAQIASLAQSLTVYVADVDDRFPDDAACALNDPEATPWLDRLVEPLPTGIRSQRAFLDGTVFRLDELSERIERADATLTSLIDCMQLPIKALLPISAIPKVLQLARLVSECGTMRPGWFDSSQWTWMRQLCRRSLEQLDEADVLAAEIAARIPADRILRVAQHTSNIHIDDVEAAWGQISRLCSSESAEELERLADLASEAAEKAGAAARAIQAFLRGMGIQTEFRPPLASSKALLACVGSLTDFGMYHGAWCDPAARNRLRQACDDAIADLTEANALREKLQERLSHRAFKSTGADLARRSLPFHSIWGRWFGGFSAFRREAAELYKSAVPDTKTLLADCDQLRLYHRRVSDPQELAQELSTLLPSSFAADDPAAWGRIRAALAGLDALLLAVPGISEVLPGTFCEIDRVALQLAHGAAQSALSHFESSLRDTLIAALIEDTRETALLAEELEQVSKAADICLACWQQLAGMYSSNPADFKHLLGDLKRVSRYANIQGELSAVFDSEREHMPLGSAAHDRLCWQRVLSGTEAAERISGLTRAPEVLRDVLCVEGQIDEAGLIVATDAANADFEWLEAALSEIESVVVLSPPETAAVDPRRRTLDMIRRIANAVARQFEARSRHLIQLTEVLRPDTDGSLDRLSDDARVIEEIRRAKDTHRQANAALRSQLADYSGQLPDGADDAAAWLLAMSDAGKITSLHRAIATLTEQRQRVNGIVGDIKQAAQSEFKDAWNFLRSIFDFRAPTASGASIYDMPVGELSHRLDRMKNNLPRLDEWLKFSRWKRDMASNGFDDVVTELLQHKYEPRETKDVIAARIYRRLFDRLGEQDRLLSEFDLQAHEKLLEQFRQLDRWEVRAASKRIRQYQLGRDDRPRLGWSTPGTSELGVLQREIQKKRRHLPLRKLFAEIPGVLQKLKPCIMMSPLSVSTFLDTDEIHFDLVIFDEASQVFPWDAIGAIYRGGQLIVAGDEKQLPPTNFFNRGDIESDEEGDDIADFESILSLCKSINMPNKRLRWHYRSRREPLIAFSNHNFYDGHLVTFPSVQDASGDSIRLELVSQGRWIDNKNLAEAERAADLVITHLKSARRSSLGVIAFNKSQQEAIEDAIYDRRRANPEIDALFLADFHEPLFIKNLENVQGDERDVILISMGYAYNEAGKFLKNFGPLTKAGGERRLNVAVTRARESLIFVTSVRAADMDLSGSTSRGSHLLKAYLDYAERGVAALGRFATAIPSECESPFEEEVAAALVRQGIEPVAQVGCGGFRIDLALKHPQRPGEFCLGIECDGATYHSSRTARDRDRIRQNVLEGLDWTILRIWSTDWIRDSQRQIGRVLAAYEAAITRPTTAGSYISARDDDGDLEADGLQPKIVKQGRALASNFARIEDVPQAAIKQKATAVLRRAGATDLDDLIKLVARELGFARTGKKIRERLEDVLNQELRVGSLRYAGDRIALPVAVDS